MNAYLKIARFDHWIKQLFILPGIIVALFWIHETQISSLLLKSLLAFFATSFVASANYVINEFLDAKFDKFHPIKKHRPLVSADVKKIYIWLEYALLSFFGLGIGYFISFPLFITEVFLLIMGILYNVPPIRLKEIAYIDVISESFNNALRFLIGWFVVTSSFIPPISILLGYWMGGAFLMAIKRYSEYKMIANKEQAAKYRKSFARYTEKSLLNSAFFYALLSVFFCGIFMIKYKIELLLAIPFICGLFCIYLSLSDNQDSSVQKPEKLFREKTLMLYIIFLALLTFSLLFIDIPCLNYFLETPLLDV